MQQEGRTREDGPHARGPQEEGRVLQLQEATVNSGQRIAAPFVMAVHTGGYDGRSDCRKRYVDGSKPTRRSTSSDTRALNVRVSLYS